MRILGIETSCDETAAAIVENGNDILSNIVATSAEIHSNAGGIIPEHAARQQIVSIIPVVERAIKAASGNVELKQYIKTKIDAISVTVGPGLIGSLLVGVETAKTLSYLWKKNIIPVNHLLGHVYANWLDTKIFPSFPLVALVVSGGHTDFIVMKTHGKVEWVGGTRDDAAGEAFDKTARLLSLPYPGGPSLSKIAQKYIEKNPEKKLNLFPRPMINHENLDCSFSGLKTSIIKQITNNDKRYSNQRLAAETQEAIVEVLVRKSLKAIKQYKPKSFLLAGGVAANFRLRKTLTNKLSSMHDNLSFHVPDVRLCTDNAAYIASCAFYNNNPRSWKDISANPQLSIENTV